MINFEYYNPAKIIFGKGVENGVGREVAKYGKRVLLHYGGGSIKRNGLYDRVLRIFWQMSGSLLRKMEFPIMKWEM